MELLQPMEGLVMIITDPTIVKTLKPPLAYPSSFSSFHPFVFFFGKPL
jgi:hypothetical protein